jgi:hypothetical protein
MWRLVLLSAVLLACGCSSNNVGKIEGTKWTSLAAKIKGISVTSGKASMEFRKDGKFFFIIDGREFAGTYTLGMGDTVQLNFNKEFVGSKSHSETMTIKDNLMTMSDSSGTVRWVKE